MAGNVEGMNRMDCEVPRVVECDVHRQGERYFHALLDLPSRHVLRGTTRTKLQDVQLRTCTIHPRQRRSIVNGRMDVFCAVDDSKIEETRSGNVGTVMYLYELLMQFRR